MSARSIMNITIKDIRK